MGEGGGRGRAHHVGEVGGEGGDCGEGSAGGLVEEVFGGEGGRHGGGVGGERPWLWWGWLIAKMVGMTLFGDRTDSSEIICLGGLDFHSNWL